MGVAYEATKRTDAYPRNIVSNQLRAYANKQDFIPLGRAEENSYPRLPLGAFLFSVAHKSTRLGSNQFPALYKRAALPIELRVQKMDATGVEPAGASAQNLAMVPRLPVSPHRYPTKR